MDITWKQQHYNNSCASACVAMLLSGYGIDKKDDDVITEAKMPYRVAYDPADGGSFKAGVLMESDEVFNSMLQHHRLMLVGPRGLDSAAFVREADGLLAKGKPFMAGVPTMAVPSPAYDEVRKRRLSGIKHCIVFHGMDTDVYLVYDPSGGLDRRNAHQFQEVREKVDLKLSKTLLGQAMSMSQDSFSIGYLDKWDGKQAEAILETLNRTRTALDEFVNAADRFGADITGSPAAKHEDILYDYLARCFKPVAMDWRTAIEAQRTKGKQQFDLIGKLYDLQDLIMRQQKELEAKPGIGVGFCAELAKLAAGIRQEAQGHLSSAYSLR